MTRPIVVLSDTEENAPDQDKDNRLELILEKARLEREVEIQEESHRRQISGLRQEVLLNQSLVQSMMEEVQVKNKRILELELKAVRATILRKEGEVPREQGGFGCPHLQSESWGEEFPALTMDRDSRGGHNALFSKINYVGKWI